MRPRHARAASIALTVAVVASFLSAAAADPRAGSATITPATIKVTWQGSHFDSASVLAPQTCTDDTCDTFHLRVDLGKGYWDGHPGALQIGIRWKQPDQPESESEYNDFDLYVYGPGGDLVAESADQDPRASSAGIASTAEVADVATAVDGTYTIKVVPSNAQDTSYHGMARVMSYEPPIAHGELSPNLVPLQPAAFHMQTAFYSLMKGEHPPSCYADETANDETHPTRCLRFDAEMANLGLGPFLLQMNFSTMGTTNEVRQKVEVAGGAPDYYPAGHYQWHAIHAHIHYRGFAKYELYGVNTDGSRGKLVGPSLKRDFCMIDVDDLWFGRAGNQSRQHHFPDCNLITTVDGHGRAWEEQGIERGWGDVYTWDLPGQYIDISSVPDGVYDVVITANPKGLIHETTRADDVAATRIRIEGSKVSCIPEPYGCPS